MKRESLLFDRPSVLNATLPPAARGLARDEIRLLVSQDGHHHTARFHDLPRYLRSGDLLIVNRSATLPASLPANGPIGPFRLNLATDYGRNLWLAEPRWSASQPGPLPLTAGNTLSAAGLSARLIAPHPQIPRLWFVQFEGDVIAAAQQQGEPIRYGYLAGRFPLCEYQTLFADTPGSAEMPSAAHPFTPRVVAALHGRGIDIAPITLHTGVSSLEVEVDDARAHPLYHEPFEVSAATAAAINTAHARGRRVIAVGTTVVRALESAWDSASAAVVPRRGFTRRYIQPATGVNVIDGLITGLHDSATSHLALLYAIAGEETIRAAYGIAIDAGFLWHEFGDSHLILR